MKTKISPATVEMFVLGALVIFIVGFLSFGGSNIFSRPSRFLIYFEESVSGLDPGAPLKFSGVRIGRVAAVNVRYDAATKKALVQTGLGPDSGLVARVRRRADHLRRGTHHARRPRRNDLERR